MTGPSLPLPANPNPSFAPDYKGAIVYPAHTTNYGYTGQNRPRGFCMHTPEEDFDNIEVTPRWFSQSHPEVAGSTHYYVDSDGDVYQCVPEREGAYANGVVGKPYPKWAATNVNLNLQTLSVEIEGFAANIQNTLIPGGVQFNALVALVRDRCAAYGIPTDREHVFGHYEVASNRSDPGAGFPWDALLEALNKPEPLPEPEPPQGGTMRILQLPVDANGHSAAYLIGPDGLATWIPTGEIWTDLRKWLETTSTDPVRPETVAFLKDKGIVIGLP